MEKLNWKKTLLLCLPIVFAVSLAITLAACMAQAGRDVDDSAMAGENIEALAGDVNNPGSVGLEFRSRGDGSCELTGIGSCTDSEIIVPIQNALGERVTSVSQSAFLGCAGIVSIRLPAGVVTIDDYAFYGSSIQTAYIPASTEIIGECAFVNCLSLTAITVDGGNENYCSLDGVLFSKDKSVLITYPSGKTGESYTIRRGVGTVSSAAFYNCTYLKSVSFNGSSAEWTAVKIGANNLSLTNLSISFLSAATK